MIEQAPNSIAGGYEGWLNHPDHYVVQHVAPNRLHNIGIGLPGDIEPRLPYLENELLIGARAIRIAVFPNTPDLCWEIMLTDGQHFAVLPEMMVEEAELKRTQNYLYIRRHYGVDYLSTHSTYEEAMLKAEHNVDAGANLEHEDDYRLDDANPVQLWQGEILLFKSEILPGRRDHSFQKALEKFQQERGEEPRGWWGHYD